MTVGGIVTPPWDLCGFDRSLDPYSWTVDEVPMGLWTRWFSAGCSWNGRPLAAAEVRFRTVQEPNALDGLWRELVFMPHLEVSYLSAGGRLVVVPLYPPVAAAVYVENVMRALAEDQRRGTAASDGPS